MNTDLEKASKLCSDLEDALCKVIKGRKDTIQLLLTALVADGHVLLEDYPGSGKTLLTKTLGRLISKEDGGEEHIQSFRRIQFTPDMLPGDVLGVNVFDPKSGTFNFVHGPIFAHIVLADELNRTGPKVQAAFLECMAEKQVTTDYKTYPLHKLFFVVGTQNPLDLAGTYPLPLVQLDRFLLKIPMSYVEHSDEIEILSKHGEITTQAETLEPICSAQEILNVQSTIETITVSDSIRETIVNIVQATRDHPMLQFGASTRAALMLQKALRAWAFISGRDFVTEDDLKYVTPFVLLHRLKSHGAAAEPKEALEEIMLPHLESLIRKSA